MTSAAKEKFVAEPIGRTGAGDGGIKIKDEFGDECGPGGLIGSKTPHGAERKVVDREKVISVDNGAVRIAPLIEPGWGRAGIAYGPFERRNGRAFAVFLVNCHNTSQSENLKETFRFRLDRWLRGPDLYSRPRRLIQWLLSKRKGRMFR
jgi:hypothetical protein